MMLPMRSKADTRLAALDCEGDEAELEMGRIDTSSAERSRGIDLSIPRLS